MRDPLLKYLSGESDARHSQGYLPQWAPKRYERCPYRTLPEADDMTQSLGETLRRRQSAATFSHVPLSIQQLSTLLWWSFGARVQEERSRRTYPSGGALYPVEGYLLAQQSSDDLAAGVYHYVPTEHALEQLPHDASQPAFEQVAPDVPCMLVLTHTKTCNMKKYGTFGYKLALIEAGHIGQNVALCATAHQIGHRPYGVRHTPPLEQSIGVDGASEPVLYAHALCG